MAYNHCETNCLIFVCRGGQLAQRFYGVAFRAIGIGVAEDYCDIFISVRDEGRHVAEAIADHFNGRGWNCRYQTKDSGVPGSSENHWENTEKLLASAKIVVVLIGPSRFIKAGPVPCYQAKEVEILADRLKEESENNTEDKLKVFFVALVPSHEINQEKDHIKEVLTLVSSQTLNRSLDEHNLACLVRNFEEETDQVHRDDVDELLRKIRVIARENRLSPRAKDENLAKEPPELASEIDDSARDFVMNRSVEAIEIDFLHSATSNWNLGIIDRRQIQIPDDVPSRYGETPFDFNSSRLMVLPAASGPDTGASGNHSVFDILLRSSDRPLLLQGAPGSGKSTTLAMTASYYAETYLAKSKETSTFVSTLSKILPTENLASKTAVFFPISLKATRIAMTTLENKIGANPITLAIAREFYGLDCDDFKVREKEELVRDRMYRQPYAIFIDGLDEVFDERNIQKILSASAELQEEHARHDLPLKIILTHRSARNYGATGLVEVVSLGNLADIQISKFFHDYAVSVGEQPEAFEMLAMKQRNSRKESDEIFRTPLFLNVFCWYLVEHPDFDGTLGKLIKTVIDHMLRGPELEIHQRLPYSQEQLRSFLSALAFSNLESRMGGNSNSFRACLDAFRAAAKVSEVETPTENDAKNLLDYFETHTGLIARRRGSEPAYKFRIPLFSEVLAGEWIHESQSLDTILDQLTDLGAVKKWDRSLSVVFYRLWNAGETTVAATIIEKILKISEDLAASADLDDWLASVFLIIGTAPRESIDEEKGRESEFKNLFYAIACFILRNFEMWTPAARNRNTLNYLKLGKRSHPILTQIATQELFRNINLNFDLRNGDWKALEKVGLQIERISSRPLLSCEFMEFVQDIQDEASESLKHEIWQHAPDEYSVLNVEDDQKVADMPWVEHSSDIWEKLRSNPATPMVYVNWYEAVAYTRWRTLRDRKNGTIEESAYFRLPSKREWEKISELTSGGATYPWRSEKPKPDAGNWLGAYVGAPNFPGLFPPNGPLELYDIGTNVRSWAWDNKSTPLGEWPPKLTISDAKLATLGASYRSNNHEVEIRAPRPFKDPLRRQNDLGIRLVLVTTQQTSN